MTNTKENRMPIKCLIVDDEQQARNVLKSHVAQLDMLSLIGECSHALAAYELLQCNEVDLIFLDIQMPKLNGLDFLRSLDRRPAVILTTAYRNFAFEGFQLDVVDYLLKPISFNRFLKSLQKAIQYPEHLIPYSLENKLAHNPFIYFRVDRQMVKVFFEDIQYLESLKDYIKIITTHKVLITKLSISKVEKMLPPNRFVRVHRSFIVNIQHITTFSTNRIEINEKVFSIGRMFKSNWNKAMLKIGE